MTGHDGLSTARLRILETTDLHMQILDYDYFADQTDKTTGLIRLVDRISASRAEPGVTTLLFDNGDFLQGNPLADHLANGGAQDGTHPMIAAFNMLGYDAIALGNHEFNYGLPFLRKVLQDAQCAVLCANIRMRDQAALALPFTILDRDVTCDDGETRRLRIGVCGFVTPQITDWDSARLSGVLVTDDIVDTAHQIVPQIKAAGADIIVALCHSGIGATEHADRMENAAVPLAAVPGIDVILSGHIHEVFPDSDRQSSSAVDAVAGTLHGKPAVMAGFYANRLGVIDLQIGWEGGTWRILHHASALMRGSDGPDQTNPVRTKLAAQVRAAHDATLAHIRQPIAKTHVPINSFLATITADLPQYLLGLAQRDFAAEMLRSGPFADLPLLSVTSPFRAGGRAGPGHYIDIAPGPLSLRDAAAIYPFADAICVIRRSGADLRQWLERSASRYRQITPGRHDQPLIDPRHPVYNCDTILGLSYSFDLTGPAMFDAEGHIRDPGASRLRDLQYEGTPVTDDMTFVVVTNSYRANGGGGFPIIRSDDTIYTSSETTRDILIRYLATQTDLPDAATQTWGFQPIPDTSAVFLSAPAAERHLPATVTTVGPGPDGFHRYRYAF